MHGYDMHHPGNNKKKEKRNMENVPHSKKLFVERQLGRFHDSIEIGHDVQARLPEVKVPFAFGPVLCRCIRFNRLAHGDQNARPRKAN